LQRSRSPFSQMEIANFIIERTTTRHPWGHDSIKFLDIEIIDCP
jgi:hypothetical protein